MRRLRCLILGLLLIPRGLVHADFLMEHYLTPSFDTDFSWWNVFYSPYGGANYPDYYATYGLAQSASAAGVTPPANSSPANPIAYWDPRNPTIAQTGTNSAFIIGPASDGNIYSYAAPTSFVLNDSKSSPIGTVLFQFQTEGTEVNFSSIALEYTNSSGQTVMIPAPTQQYIREYAAGSSSYGGYTARVAIQWNLTGLGITSYEIVWAASGSSMSFQEALLDTASTYGAVVPALRTWNSSGAGLWSDGTKWLEGATSITNGNVEFTNPAATTISLNSSQTQGEVIFNSPADVTINSTNGSTLTANTGVTTNATATGSYTINANYALGAFSVFHIAAGTVTVNGVVSGPYGLVKEGDGTLIFAQNNTFTGSAGVGVNGGTLILNGSNAYTGSTSILLGNLIVGANAGATGALGSSTTDISLGADSDEYAYVGAGVSKLLIQGDHTISRNVDLSNGTYEKHLGALNTNNGATFSGTINFTTSNNVYLTAQNKSDVVTFSGTLNGSTTTSVYLDGLGAVVYAGTAKTYTGSTTIESGTLRLAAGTTFSGTGAISVGSGASLLVDGTLSGAGALTLASGALLGGSGSISRSVSIGNGAIISPGEGLGALALTGTLTLAAGGQMKWEINSGAGTSGTNWDTLNLTGTLAISSTSSSPFVINANSLASSGAVGAASAFDPSKLYDWTLITASAGITGYSAADFAVDLSSFTNSYNGAFSVKEQGSSLILEYSPAPEPSRSFFLLLGGVALLGRRRRPGSSRVALTNI